MSAMSRMRPDVTRLREPACGSRVRVGVKGSRAPRVPVRFRSAVVTSGYKN